MPASEVMTIEQLAKYLQIAKSTLYKLSQEGRIPAQKVGKHWRFHREAIDRWLTADAVPHATARVSGPHRTERGR